jgi:D-arabinono-1,4-lactone oxidase
VQVCSPCVLNIERFPRRILLEFQIHSQSICFFSLTEPGGKGFYAHVLEKIPDVTGMSRSGVAEQQYALNSIDAYASTARALSLVSWLGKRTEAILPAFVLDGMYGIVEADSLRNIYKLREPQPFDAYPSELFTDTKRALLQFDSGHLASYTFEFGLPQDRAVEALWIVIRALRSDPVLTALEIRFNKKSRATLAFTKYDNTVTIDVPIQQAKSGWYSNADATMKKIANAMEASGIPHTYHWGKNYPMNDRWVPAAYGASLTEWRTKRERLLDADAQAMFSTGLLRELGVL